MEEALRTFLLANAGLAALVGTRITWLTRPQGSALPAVTLQVVSAGRGYTMQGREGLVGRLVQMDCWATSYASMKATERALVAALDGLKTDPFQGAFIESDGESHEAGDAADAQGSTDYFRARLDVRVWHFSPA